MTCIRFSEYVVHITLSLMVGLIHLVTQAQWIVHSDKYCAHTLLDHIYSAVEEAQSQCSAMSYCWGVYDEGCDDQGNVFMCDADAISSPEDLDISKSGSCVYERPYQEPGSSS